MNKALAVLVLLSVVCAPRLSYSQSATTKELARVELVTAKGIDFYQVARKLCEVSFALEDIAKAKGANQGPDSLLATMVLSRSLLSSCSVINLTSTIVYCGTFATQKDGPQQYFFVVRSGLNYAKNWITIAQNLQGMYAYIENKAALYEADKGRQLLSEALKLIDETIGLLPPKKSND